MAENAPRCPAMAGNYSEVIGCLRAALEVLLGGGMDFKIVDGFVMDLETGFTLVLKARSHDPILRIRFLVPKIGSRRSDGPISRACSISIRFFFQNY